MHGRNIIVIGSSAGSMEALRDICGGLPRDLAAAVFVVVHTGPSSPRVLPQVLDRLAGPPAAYAKDLEPIRMGRIYIAQPDRHLLLARGRIDVTAGPKENGFRPAVDPLFRSAAKAYGRRVVGVVLSGGMDDGTEGLRDIKSAGGVALVQDPEEALFRSMPMNAILHVEVDRVLRAAQIAAELVRMVNEPLSRVRTRMKLHKHQQRPIEPAKSGEAAMAENTLPGAPSGLTCPECGGALWELRDRNIVKYRCHVGHGYTEQAMVNNQDAAVEGALWAAVRALEEKAALRQRMADRALKGKLEEMARTYAQRAQHAHQQACAIRDVLNRSITGTGNGGNGEGGRHGGGDGNGNGNGENQRKRGENGGGRNESHGRGRASSRTAGRKKSAKKALAGRKRR